VEIDTVTGTDMVAGTAEDMEMGAIDMAVIDMAVIDMVVDMEEIV